MINRLSGSAEEGVRRSICDMTLLIFHLFLSSFTHNGVDVMMAQKIVDWNLKRYPEGKLIDHLSPLLVTGPPPIEANLFFAL
jgi:hypothetical protein